MANGRSNNKNDKDQNNVVEVSFVAAVFDDVNAAKKAYDALKDLRREGWQKSSQRRNS
jgi:DNA polymerase IIIc chi subunit